MTYDRNHQHRRSVRLPGYDYSQAGAYFVTICVQNRECLFGEISGGTMRLNAMGRVLVEEWIKTTETRMRLEGDVWVVMPNHFQGIVTMIEDGAAARRVRRGTARCARTFGKPQPGALTSVIRAFKSAVTKRINELRQTPGRSLWQRNYYEHIIRNDADLLRIREYIHNNPSQWESDQLHPA